MKIFLNDAYNMATEEIYDEEATKVLIIDSESEYNALESITPKNIEDFELPFVKKEKEVKAKSDYIMRLSAIYTETFV